MLPALAQRRTAPCWQIDTRSRFLWVKGYPPSLAQADVPHATRYAVLAGETGNPSTRVLRQSRLPGWSAGASLPDAIASAIRSFVLCHLYASTGRLPTSECGGLKHASGSAASPCEDGKTALSGPYDRPGVRCGRPGSLRIPRIRDKMTRFRAKPASRAPAIPP